MIPQIQIEKILYATDLSDNIFCPNKFILP